MWYVVQDLSRQGSIWRVRERLERGGNIVNKRKAGRVPLWIAASIGHVDCAQLVIESGSDVDKIPDDGAANKQTISDAAAISVRCRRGFV